MTYPTAWPTAHRPPPTSWPPPPNPAAPQQTNAQAGGGSQTAPPRHIAARREQPQAANARYQTWATGTSSRREAAGKACAELQRRGLAQQTAGQPQAEPEREPQTMV